MTPKTFSSEAWLLEGWTQSTPGILTIQSNHLVFSISARVVFDVPLEQISNITFPWYYFGGGMKLTFNALTYRLSFIKPNGAEYAAGQGLARSANPLALMVAALKITDVRDGRKLAQQWKKFFSK